jgi:hypothetical protein
MNHMPFQNPKSIDIQTFYVEKKDTVPFAKKTEPWFDNKIQFYLFCNEK